ncbi:MAG: NAD-dependent epimerase/dehydratase family protein [bacterium]
MKIFVTGGAGFIGSHITDRLIEHGHKVIVVDNLSTGRRDFVNPKAKFYHLDIHDRRLNAVFSEERPDILCHHAAQVNVRKSVEDPVYDAETNILGTLHLLKLSVTHGVKKIIFASTGGAIYGEQDYYPADENHPNRPISPYGISKLAVEKYLYYYHYVYDIDYISLRYAHVYGPRQDPYGEAGVVAIFIEAMLSGKSPVIHGDGQQTGDFIYVDDVVEANMACLAFAGSDTFNIGTGIETSINQVFRKVQELTETTIEGRHGPGPKGEQKRNAIDPQKAINDLHWEPRTSLAEGLKKTVAYFASELKKSS